MTIECTAQNRIVKQAVSAGTPTANQDDERRDADVGNVPEDESAVNLRHAVEGTTMQRDRSARKGSWPAETGPVTGSPAHTEPLMDCERELIAALLRGLASAARTEHRNMIRVLAWRVLGCATDTANKNARSEEAKK